MKKIILATLSCFLANHAIAEYALGTQYYKTGQLNKAFREYQYSAVMGEPNAQFNLGVMYYRGEAVAEDIATGYAWLTLAGESKQEKYVQALNDLKSHMSPTQLAEGEKKLSELKKSLSNYAVLHKLMPAPDISNQKDTPYKIIKKTAPRTPKAAVLTYQSGLVRLGFTIAKDGSVRNIRLDLSDPLFDQSAVDALHHWQFSPAMMNDRRIDTHGLSQVYSFSGKFSLLSDEADKFLKVYEDKAKTGSAEDIYQFAFFTEVIDYLRRQKNPDTKMRGSTAMSDYRQAGGKGFPLAEYRLASHYLGNQRYISNGPETYSWLERAASHGVPDAQFLLGLEYFGGDRVAKDEVKGIYWLDKASAAGSANAKVKLAWIYATHSDPALRDAKKAKACFDSVAETHLDQLSYWETKAAVAALNQDFSAAINAQKIAIKKSTEYGLTLPLQQTALGQYQANKIWIDL